MRDFPSTFLRTDMACELREIMPENTEGLSHRSDIKSEIPISCTEITSSKASALAGKPIGKYVNIDVGNVCNLSKSRFFAICDIVSCEIASFIPNHGMCLVVGLGNRNITADATGPITASHIVITRHIAKSNHAVFEKLNLREVSCTVPDVTGNTGMEAAEIIKGIVSETHPGFVIAIDSLVSRKLSRLASAIQICNTGISPGSGIFNNRSALNQETLGVPVISIGVPTVVNAATLTIDTLEKAKVSLEENTKTHIYEENKDFFVTPKETDHIIADVSKLVGYAINKSLHRDLTYDDMDEFLS